MTDRWYVVHIYHSFPSPFSYSQTQRVQKESFAACTPWAFSWRYVWLAARDEAVRLSKQIDASCMSLYLSGIVPFGLQDRGVLSVARDGRQVTSGYKGTPFLRPDNNNRANRVAGDCVTSCEWVVPSSVFISSLSCSPFTCNSSVHVYFVFSCSCVSFPFFSPAFSVLHPTSRSCNLKVLGLKYPNRAVPFCDS